MSHGGPRNGSGRKPRAWSRSVPKSIKVSQEVADYLAAVGTGIIEDLIRASKDFREHQKQQSTCFEGKQSAGS